jgi:hypothetical protein
MEFYFRYTSSGVYYSGVVETRMYISWDKGFPPIRRGFNIMPESEFITKRKFEDTQVVIRSANWRWTDNTIAKRLVGLVGLTPLSTIFQLYRDGQIYWWRKPVDLENNHRPVASHWQTLSHNVVHLALIEIRTHNISGDWHWLHR